MKKIIAFFVLLLIVIPTFLKAQSFPEALEYKFPKLSSVPPHYSGQPTDVVLSYYWFDQAMRTYNWHVVDSFFSAMQYSDTAKYIADAIYRVTADNPISFHLWLAGRGVHPDPYKPKADPSHSKIFFESKFAGICNDTGRSGFLVASDIIAHIRVIDTISLYDSTAMIAKHMVRVSTQIIDEIKGKYVPDCIDDNIYSIKGGHPKPLSYDNNANAHSADSGNCLQFEYSYEWDRQPFNDEGTGLPLIDSTGTWIRPGIEYIVFLGIQSIRADSAYHYFTIKPLWGVFGKAAGMYPIHSGIVYDPSDDFGIGANAGLTVSQWKSRLRARINQLINP